ncbi:VOC family protein [Noviherbaspirillum sedimenti]|uniref:VOC domain-containing protein n=1 Tax=Noviherbaspirillum sedimenti TaxID=2320865 RepID=A0A3A3G6E5_9BURK|nr:VOC family protein [Noviherbaspirillum sedimenti]RJG04008.1 hypothetical protein D3878_22445 [Noviherbaspirillum sedimenti]
MAYKVGGLRLAQPFRIRRVGHFGYHTPDLAGTLGFLTRHLGLVISDVEDFSSKVPQLPKEHGSGYFLRCGTDHHTIVIGSQMLVDTREPNRKGAIVGQISWQVGSLQEVVDGVSYLDRKARIRRIGRDAPGSNWHAYAYDPDGYINEVFYGMEQIGWDGYSKPKSMYGRAFHECPSLPQIPEYEEVQDALDSGDQLAGFRPVLEQTASYSVDGILMPRPFKLTRLGRITLFVEDLDVSVAFYRDVMGLQPSEKVKVGEHTAVVMRAGDEHHTLMLLPAALKASLGFAAAIGFEAANYQQLREAYQYMQQQGIRILDLPAEISPGVHYGFWVQGPDQIAVQIFYGMDRVERDGSAPQPTTTPLPPDSWPDAIAHGDSGWYELPYMGPMA